MDKNTDRRFLRLTWGLAPLVPLIWMAISLSWFGRVEGVEFSGMLQGDQAVYTAMARAVFWHGNGLVYSNPYDPDPLAPRVLCNLGYVLLGWLIRPFEQAWIAWEIWRLAWGTVCFGLWGLLVCRVLERPGVRWWAWAAGTFGGGLAWLILLIDPPVALKPGIMEQFIQVEDNYGWWCLNLFRQGLYPMELFYHALLLGSVLAWWSRRRGVLLALLFALWWTHIITALLATTVVGVLLVLDYRREGLKAELRTLCVMGLFAACFTFYYRGFLPTFPAIRSWMEQTLSLKPVLHPWGYFAAFGLIGLIAISTSAAAFATSLRRQAALADRRVWLISVWLVVTLLWMNNHWFFTEPIQPLHFSRAYPYLALVLAAGFAFERVQFREKPPRRALVCAAGLSLLLLIPDNALFATFLLVKPPEAKIALLHPTQRETITWVREDPRDGIIHSRDQGVGRLLLLHTPAKVFTSEAFLTPFFGERMLQISQLTQAGDCEGLRGLGIDRLIIAKDHVLPIPEWMRDRARFQVLRENDGYLYGEIVE